MATTDTVLTIPPQDFHPEAGNNPAGGEFGLVSVGLVKGLGYVHGNNAGAVAIKRLPANASLATGATVKLQIADDPNNAGAGGLVTKWGVNFAIVGDGTARPLDLTNIGTEATGTLTMAATVGQAKELSIAIVVANMGGAAASKCVLLRVRRLGADSADTDPGRAVVLNVTVLDT